MFDKVLPGMCPITYCCKNRKVSHNDSWSKYRSYTGYAIPLSQSECYMQMEFIIEICFIIMHGFYSACSDKTEPNYRVSLFSYFSMLVPKTL